MRALLVTLAALAVFPAAAAADTISVVPEPAGANCPAGGVKITVTPTPPAPPAPPPPDQVSYVCSGPAGADGAPGTDGAPGADGTDGTDGVDGQDGSNGFDGSDATSSGSGATTTSRTPSCGKASRVITWHLPARFKRVTSATVIVGGHKRTVTITRGAVSVDLHGLACGSYPIVIQRRGIRPVVRIFTLDRSGRIGRTSVV
jgi:hypothetical protein